MKIKTIKISNYRNLDSTELSFEDNCNFIVGENNLGKSNFLSLLNTLFSYRNFKYDDFTDPEKPIDINLSIKLQEVEIGHFQDLFDSDDCTNINIIAQQENPDDNINFYHKETNTFIQSSTVKCINYIHYDSLRNPITEINFDKGKGVGKFLKNIIAKYLKNNGLVNSEFLNDNQVQALLDSINQTVSKVKTFKEFGISASSDNDVESLLSRIVVFKDQKGNSLTKTGYGVQYLILVTLSILEKLQVIQQQRGERGIFEDPTTTTKSISLLIGLDEPEIHLHPYMQRSLIKYICSILTNNNSDFSELIKDLFDIDEFIGQVITVTHSPNIILADYKQIIRFYSDQQSTKIVSGSEIDLNPQLRKHLLMNFPFIKEAFFSRCVIFVEGETELSSFPYFAQTLSIHFDDLGICVIQARGGAVEELIELSNKFGIQSVGIVDRDSKLGQPSNPQLYYTNLRDFEDEVVSLIDTGLESSLRAILCNYDALGAERIIDSGALTKKLNSYKLHNFPVHNNRLKLSEIALTDLLNLKAYYLTWLIINKGCPLGMTIGNSLKENEIPIVYKNIISEAKRLVENV